MARSPVSLSHCTRFAPLCTIAAALALAAGAVPAAAEPAPAAHSGADNVEVLVDRQAAADLPAAAGASSAPDALADAVVAGVLGERSTELSALAAADRDVRVDIRESADGAAFGVAIVTAPEAEGEEPYAWLFAAELRGGAWTVGLEGDETFSGLLAGSALLDGEERAALAASTAPGRASASQATGVGLPFATGTSMVMTGGPHGFGSGPPYSSVDFAGGAGQARAAAGGYAYSLCTGWTRVIHGNGYSTDYYHLEDYQWLPGNDVGAGHYLGTQGNSLCAGGSTTGAHIHFSLRAYTDPDAAGWYVPLNGLTLGGWTFVEGAAYGGHAYRDGVGTVYPGGSMYNYGP
ncbi:M23 family metallopeptidase [Nocardiopsis composta]|uniref:Murein DD-endopeptidase MepM/ murein hydrolase activator NlpD n=1 Tax=Nocardiopsis composta TaxID=157465 RepID=A0A7W8QI66_9ACTN|nr:M23 family metallopeptidase [Nocardiopsis composta]MBB5430933.1 murein DD-endopeptidase MepM/ murein hydrolase activator NlpD [Nocardiopsis composta]